MIHPKERRCESLRTTKNVLESLNQILSIETHSPSEKETRGSDGAQRNLPRTITNQSVKDNHSFFTQYFNRSVGHPAIPLPSATCVPSHNSAS